MFTFVHQTKCGTQASRLSSVYKDFVSWGRIVYSKFFFLWLKWKRIHWVLNMELICGGILLKDLVPELTRHIVLVSHNTCFLRSLTMEKQGSEV